MPDQAKSIVEESIVVNGIDVTEFENTIQAVREDPALAKFQFRARNVWTAGDGGYNRTAINRFYGAGEEQGTEGRAFFVDADEPPVLLGEDKAPNPVEYVLHALAACLTSSIVYKAAQRGIKVESIESTLEGDLDAHAFLELSQDQRKGYQQIRANFKVRSDAGPGEIRELAEFSPVLDIISHDTPVSIQIENA